MKTTRTRFRAIALVLAMATVFLSVSFTVVAEDFTVINQNEIITDITEEVSFGNPDEFIPAVYEVEDLREENVKHFSLPDGTYQAVSYFRNNQNYDRIMTIVTHEILHLFGVKHHEDSGYTSDFCLYYSTSKDKLRLCDNCIRDTEEAKFKTLYAHS